MKLDEVIALINSDDGKELPLSLLEKGVPEMMAVAVDLLSKKARFEST
ncbi:MAG: hypothetical protein P8R36_03585 [Actinomycetota bacterium]|nr:hypothetical protein [Actinomycetota bacterium]